MFAVVRGEPGSRLTIMQVIKATPFGNYNLICELHLVPIGKLHEKPIVSLCSKHFDGVERCRILTAENLWDTAHYGLG